MVLILRCIYLPKILPTIKINKNQKVYNLKISGIPIEKELVPLKPRVGVKEIILSKDLSNPVFITATRIMANNSQIEYKKKGKAT